MKKNKSPVNNPPAKKPKKKKKKVQIDWLIFPIIIDIVLIAIFAVEVVLNIIEYTNSSEYTKTSTKFSVSETMPANIKAADFLCEYDL